jgi:hypothetical protein
VEDSGDWSAFIEGVRNPIAAKPPYPNLIPHMPHIVKPLYKGLGIIHLKPWFVKSFVYKNMPKKASDFFEKDLNLFIKP